MKKEIMVGLIIVVIFALNIPGNLFCLEPIGNSPQRIISLGPAITEELYLLGVEDKIVGVTTYCKRPIEAQKKEKVGTVMKVNVEKIVSLKPDLVLSSALSDLAQMEKLRSLGVRVEAFSSPKSFSEICQQFLKLSKIVCREEKAIKIILQSEKKVEFIKEKVKGLSKPKVFVQVGAKPLFTITKDSFIQDLISLSGGINIAEEARSGFYSREKVLKENPDVIIIVTMGIVGQNEKKTWEKFKTLKAAKKRRIYILDSYKVCSPTPLTFVEALEEISKLLHP